VRTERDFADSAYWDDLARKRLKGYALPDWSEPCTEQAMRKWELMLDLDKGEYEGYTATPYSDFIRLNPEWPLRAWLGLVMEYAEENR